MAKYTQHVYGQRPTFTRDKHAESEGQATQGVHVVYYIKFSPTRIKIGTTQNLLQRLSELQRTRADVMALEFGSYGLEHQRHREFAHLLVSGREVFRTGRDLLDHMAGLRALLLTH